MLTAAGELAAQEAAAAELKRRRVGCSVRSSPYEHESKTSGRMAPFIGTLHVNAMCSHLCPPGSVISTRRGPFYCRFQPPAALRLRRQRDGSGSDRGRERGPSGKGGKGKGARPSGPIGKGGGKGKRLFRAAPRDASESNGMLHAAAAAERVDALLSNFGHAFARRILQHWRLERSSPTQ